MLDSPTFIPSVLYVTASEQLQKDVKVDLEKDDPEDKDSTIARLVKDADEDTK